MPLYEYECDVCAHRFELIQKFSDPPPAACPKCGGAVTKLMSSPAIQFKGSGFYLTDYGRSGSKSDSANVKGGKNESGSSSSGESKSDSKSSESKSSESKSSDSGSSSKSDSGSSSGGSDSSSKPAKPAAPAKAD
jgi:putative FmdB family regulatory protein